VEVKDGLAGAGSHVDGEAVVVEAGLAGGLGDELEHALRFLGRELADLLEAGDVALGQDEQVCFRLGIDVADRDESVSRVDVVALAVEVAEEAIRLRQRGSPPP
jgi:hypothetical protein